MALLLSIARFSLARFRAPRAALLLSLALLVAPALQACSGAANEQHATGKAVRPYLAADVTQHMTAATPAFVTDEVRDGYEYALAHPDQLRYMPCYCGCGLNGNHKSNADCYVAGIDKDDKVVFDDHASFCQVCLEITRDVKQLSAQGKSLREIRTFIDQAHGEKGPGTDTPLPPL